MPNGKLYRMGAIFGLFQGAFNGFLVVAHGMDPWTSPLYSRT